MSSKNKEAMKVNDDGAVDVYFTSNPFAGKDKPSCLTNDNHPQLMHEMETSDVC